jgi:phosphate transport system substrate-binding protein
MRISSFFVIMMMLLVACSSPKSDSQRQYDNNSITIAADEAFQPMLDQIYQTFMATTPGKTIKITYRPEEEAISLMLRDTARLVLTTRELNEDEKKVFTSQGAIYKLYPIATDGVALITHEINKDILFSTDELSQIFNNKVTAWNQLEGGNIQGKITLVFDNANSTNLRFVMKKFGLKNVNGLNIFAAGSNEKVIEYVRQNPNAMGFIGVNWISDGESPLSAKLSQGLNVVGITDKKNPTKADYYQPFQRDIGLKRYPLHRQVYIISRDTRAGLGSDFINYIVRDVGPLIIEKCGLWPAKPANREVIINTKL